MINTIKFTLLVLILVAVAFLGWRFSKQCPEADPALIEALTADIARRDAEILVLGEQATKYKAIADSLANRKPTTIHEVLPTIPRGRNTAELDSIGAIIFQSW